MALRSGSFSRREQELELADLATKYAARGVPRAETARTPSQLLDLVVRHEMSKTPRLSYSQAQAFVFSVDLVLKRLYAES